MPLVSVEFSLFQYCRKPSYISLFCFCSLQINVLQSKRRSEILKSVSILSLHIKRSPAQPDWLSEYSVSSPQMLSFMYAHLTFFHQGYDLFSELQPLMKLLGGQVQATNKHTPTPTQCLCASRRLTGT